MRSLLSSGLVGFCAAASFVCTASLEAASVYWNNTSLDWNAATATWNTAADGSGVTQNWSNGDSAIFSAGAALTGLYNINNGGVTVNDISQEEGRIRIQNNTLTLADAAMVIDTQARVSGDFDIRIDSVIANSGAGASSIAKNGTGILMLIGNNTFSGGFTLNNGTAAVEQQSNAFGAGTLTLNGGNLVKSWGTTPVIFPNPVNVTGTTNVAIVDQGQGNDIKFTGTFTGSGTFQVNNTAVNGMNIRNSSIKILSDISGFQGTFRDSQTTGSYNRLRFGPEGSGNFGIVDGSHAKFVLSGPVSATGSQLDLGDGAYGIFKLGELSGTGGFLTVGWNALGGTSTFEIGGLNTSSTFAGVIANNGTGVAAVTKTGTGTLTLTGANTYSGATIIAGGGLQLGNGAVDGTVTNTSSVVNNGVLAYNWAASHTAAYVISGTGGVTKDGAGTLVLGGVNTYTGGTVVNAGKIAVNGSSLADDSTLAINGGQVDVTGTEVVGKLFFGNVAAAVGTYGSSASTATIMDDVHFTGTGVVSVTSSGSAYDSWAISKGLTAANNGPMQDPDSDGIPNLLEFVLSGNPLAADGSIAPVILDDPAYLAITFSRSDDSESSVLLNGQWSTDLGVWNDIPVGAMDSDGVLIQENGASPDTVMVFVPKTQAVNGRLFIRLKASN